VTWSGWSARSRRAVRCSTPAPPRPCSSGCAAAPSPRTRAPPRSARRSRRILGRIADGLTDRQIGAELFLAEKTVTNYVSSLLRKLGFARRTEAAAYAADLRRGQ
jgi:DNA-binding NarL/FixJ family response regulator